MEVVRIGFLHTVLVFTLAAIVRLNSFVALAVGLVVAVAVGKNEYLWVDVIFCLAGVVLAETQRENIEWHDIISGNSGRTANKPPAKPVTPKLAAEEGYRATALKEARLATQRALWYKHACLDVLRWLVILIVISWLIQVCEALLGTSDSPQTQTSVSSPTPPRARPKPQTSPSPAPTKRQVITPEPFHRPAPVKHSGGERDMRHCLDLQDPAAVARCASR